MALVRYVAFFPPTGARDRQWIHDRACDLLVKSGRRVAEVYSEEIHRAGLVGPCSEVRVFLRPGPPDQRHVRVEVQTDRAEGRETAVALIPHEVARLDAEQRAELAFRILAGVVQALAPHRGWSADDLDAAEAAVRHRGLEFTWHGPWTASPDRRHEARGTFWLEDDGFGRAVIELRRRWQAEAEVSVSASAPAYGTAAGFARSAQTLRWQGGSVTMTPSVDILDRAEGLVRLDRADAGRAAVIGRQPGEKARPEELPTIEFTTSGRVPEAHVIRFVGGGPTNGVPSSYLRTLERRLAALSTSGIEWWSGADRTLLQISYEITDTDQGAAVRRLSERVTATIRRPLSTLSLRSGSQAARDDVDDLVDAVTKRMSLTGRPPL